MIVKLKSLKYILPVVLTLAACSKNSKFLNINTDPNSPTTIGSSKLLTTVERNVGDGLAIAGGQTGGLSEVLAVYTHQMSTREEPDQYGVRSTNFWVEQAWPTLNEFVIANSNQIIKDATAGGNSRYVGIAKILKAYAYSQLVDVFGDIPFSEAGQLKEGVKYPKFDDDATIYPQLFTMLDEGIADINKTSNVVVPGGDDIIYGGKVANWVKAANTIKLKLYTQIRKVKDVKTEVTALLSNPATLINATNESFLIPYGPNGNTDDRNPGFADYTASQRTNHVSPWFYEILKGYNPRIFTGNPDPRVPYYIYNQLKKTSTPDNDTEYRDSAFVSIYFGSGGPNRDKNQQNSISLYGIYPVGGRYDDGAGGVASAASGTGAAPYRLITYADRLYLEAELIKDGVVAGDAKAKLQAAMQESFKQVDYVITQYVKPSQTVPALVGSTAVTNYITKVLAEYDAKPAQQLEIIMTQKWISSFGSSVDQYTDIRRTGFPVLFNPSDPLVAPGGKVQPPINGDPVKNPGAQPAVPVSMGRPFALSLPWPQTELETNSSAPPQKSPSTYKVFWMP